MKALRILLASACLALFSNSPAMAQGFGWKGKTADEMELTFDEKVVKRDSPESLLKSFFSVMFNLRAKDSVFLKMQRLQLETEMTWLKPLITEAAYKEKFGPRLKELEIYKKHPPRYKIDIENVDKSRAETIIRFLTTFQSTRPCRQCNPNGEMKEGEKDCKECEGKGLKTDKDESKGRVTIHSVDGKLFIKSLDRACYSCKATKVCSRCKNKDGNDKCYSCKDTKVCSTCSGSGYRADRTLIRGPGILTNLPKKVKLELSPDLSNPKSTFSLFTDALVQTKRERSALENRCLRAFRQFQKAFIGELPGKPREMKFREMDYKLVKKEEVDENTLKFHFSALSAGTQEQNKGKDELKNARYTLVLIKVKDQWKINSFLEKCWRCDGSGVDYDKTSCKECKGKKYKPSLRLP